MPVQRSLRLLSSAFLAAALLCGVLAAPALLAAQKPYHIVDRWKVGGEGGWDYLLADPGAHRLYLSPRRARGCARYANRKSWLARSPACKALMASRSTAPANSAISPTAGPMRSWSSTAARLPTVATIPSGAKPRRHPLRAGHADRLGLQWPQQGSERDRCRHAESGRDDPAARQARVRRRRWQGNDLRQHRRQERDRPPRRQDEKDDRRVASRRLRIALRAGV